MGADLTITKSGRYYRDSYNNSNGWEKRGMSYWAMQEVLHKNKMLTQNGAVTVKGVDYILEQISGTKFPTLKQYEKIWKKQFDGMDDWIKKSEKRPEQLLQESYDWAKQHDADMIAFWEEAKRLKSTVEWSV